MSIKIFYFVAQMGDRWQGIVREQLQTIRESGLLAACEKIYICQAGKQKFNYGEKTKVVYYSNLDQFEYPALHMVKEYTKPGDVVLYMHTKGASRKHPHIESGDHWRQYMMWGCVERWREHIEALKTHDVSGVQLTTLSTKFKKACEENVVYAGNFWWTSADYLDKLTAPEIDKKNRWGAEGWIMGANPNCFDLHNLTNGEPITTHNTFSLPDFGRHVYDKMRPRMVNSRHEIINALIKKHGYKSYCEIGVWHFDCYRHIECAVKECVDPGQPKATHVMPSDDFFKANKRQWDIFFIDGLHTEAQVYQDILNALDCLAPGGTIVMHDCNPETEWEQRDTTDYDGKGVWVGTVWRAFARLRMERQDLDMHVIDADFGCGIIRKGKQKTYPKSELTYPFFVQHRRELMNVIEPEEFYSWLAK